MKFNTYVNYGGNCAEALHYYEQHLGGKIVTISTWAQSPMSPPPGLSADSTIHARIIIGDTLLMASDAPTNQWEPMRSAYLTLGFDSNEETERAYEALGEGGKIFMKLEETFFAHRFAMLQDKFGANWMIIHEKPMPGGV
jgi:PhnB protein